MADQQQAWQPPDPGSGEICVYAYHVGAMTFKEGPKNWALENPLLLFGQCLKEFFNINE